MKQFSCGDVVPGCGQVFHGADDAEILAAVGVHARADHGLAAVPDSLVQQVRTRIVQLA